MTRNFRTHLFCVPGLTCIMLNYTQDIYGSISYVRENVSSALALIFDTRLKCQRHEERSACKVNEPSLEWYIRSGKEHMHVAAMERTAHVVGHSNTATVGSSVESHYLTSRSKILLRGLLVVQLVEKMSAFLRNPEVHSCNHSSLQLVSIPRQINPVHNYLPYFLNIHFNISFPYASRSSSFCLPIRFSNKNLV
jgi:hypothetical protein